MRSQALLPCWRVPLLHPAGFVAALCPETNGSGVPVTANFTPSAAHARTIPATPHTRIRLRTVLYTAIRQRRLQGFPPQERGTPEGSAMREPCITVPCPACPSIWSFPFGVRLVMAVSTPHPLQQASSLEHAHAKPEGVLPVALLSCTLQDVTGSPLLLRKD